MSNSFTPRFEILPEQQKKLWPELALTKDLGFVLYGGTAIALQLGHRQSIDFNFFSDIELNEQTLFRSLPFLKEAKVTQQEENTLSFEYVNHQENTPVKLSFFGGIGFGRVGEPLITEDKVLVVANLKDLLATKLATVMSRIEIKDYLDIAALIKHGLSLEEGLEHTALLYDQSFTPLWCLKTLIYFDEPKLKNIPEHVKDTLIKECEKVNLDSVRTDLSPNLLTSHLSNFHELENDKNMER